MKLGIICNIRKWMKLTPVHSYRRVTDKNGTQWRVCRRCGDEVPVKHRAKSQEAV